MKWRKLGLIFAPTGRSSWMASHAACPVAEQLEDRRYRIYFSPRDRRNRSSIASLDIDIGKPNEVFNISSEPILQKGSADAFDATGVSVGCLVPLPNEHRLYYMGWQSLGPKLWRNEIGVCTRTGPDGAFIRRSSAPVMGVNPHDPYSLTYPWVHHDESGWRMWYGSHLTKADRRADIRHVLKMARSSDGISWQADDRIVIDLVGSDFAVTKPCVIRDPNRWRMWYSRCREDAYRIGYAESDDGYVWRCRDEDVGIHPSSNGWDQKSIEYGCVFDCRSDRYMLYCGFEYGRTGFGLAVLEQD